MCLFARNIKEPKQVRDLTDSIKEIIGGDALICIDQEGGRVDRLRRILEPMPAVESLRDSKDAEALGRFAGQALSLLGINVDFAPVVDVRRDEFANIDNGLQTRMLSGDANEVAQRASAFIEGLHSYGVAGCLKHFPGLGASSVDSHEMLPIVEATDDKLESTDLIPYRELIDSGNEMVMIAHAAYPNSLFRSDDPALPSSLNPKIYSFLRVQMKFEGLAITDDLEMGAIVKAMGVPIAARMSIEAGADIALICNDQNAVLEAVDLCRKEFKDGYDREFSERISHVTWRFSPPVAFDKSEWEHLSQKIAEFKSHLS